MNRGRVKKIVISGDMLCFLEKPTVQCEKCRLSLPCLFGHHTIQLQMIPLYDTSATNNFMDFATTTTYGETQCVQARVGNNGASSEKWISVPFQCPRFNPRAKAWHGGA